MARTATGLTGRRALRASVVALAVAASTATGAIAQNLVVQGTCRDGVPHGGWQLETAGGKLRALGAFSRGKRTGSFIFWNAAGVRIAHLPYEDNAKNGTLALWYETASQGRDAQQRLEAVYSHGQLNGFMRIWHPDGRVRGEYAYAAGQLALARGWDSRGRELSEASARKQAERDVAVYDGYYQTLEALVARHVPDCDGEGPPKRR